MLDHSFLDRVFHALADPTRRAMLERLAQGRQSVSALGATAAMSLAAVVQHVQVLEEARLVRSEKQGRVRTCRLDDRTLAAAGDWIAARRVNWERHLERRGERLAEAAPRKRNRL